MINRTVINVGVDESFRVGWAAPYSVSVKVTPSHFSLATGEKQVLTVILNATKNNSIASYGRIGIFGNRGHVVNIQLSVIYKTHNKVIGS